MSCFPLRQSHIETFVPEKKKRSLRLQFAQINRCNGLNFLGFSCSLLFCVGGNPIGGLRKSQNKCFQMMMSCRKKKRENLEKGFQQPDSERKKKSRSTHAYILLARGRLCRKTTLYSASVYYFRFLCAKAKGETTDFTEGQ